MKEIKIASKLMYCGSLVSFYRDDVMVENKGQTKRDVIKQNHFAGAICALCIDEDNNVICVKQYRYTKKTHSISCVSGYIEKNELPHKAMMREVSEEIGGDIIEYKKITTIWPLIAYSYEQTHCYFVKIKNQLNQQKLDHLENITIVKMTIAELYEYANSSQVTSLNFKLMANFLYDEQNKHKSVPN